MFELSFSSTYAEDGRRLTTVELFDERVVIEEATVIRNPKDKENRIVGQKWAVKCLTKKFSENGLRLKDIRGQIWQAFFNHSTKTKRLLAK